MIVWVIGKIILSSQEQPKLFRLHISKKEYPKASLIIGGKDENYGFIAVHENKNLKYNSKKEEKKILMDFSVDNDKLNTEMREINTVIDKWNKLDRLATNQDEKHSLRRAHVNELISISDTCSTLLPAIYAAYFSDFGFNKKQVHESMNKIRNRLGSHEYLHDYSVKDQSKYFMRILLIIILCFSLLWMTYKLRKNHNDNFKNRRLLSLTVREREIFNLIKHGRSNKEISNSLNIEISTVKRHINNIFSKLKIKSRNKTNTYNEK